MAAADGELLLDAIGFRPALWVMAALIAAIFLAKPLLLPMLGEQLHSGITFANGFCTLWRREWDSNPRYGFPHTRFPSVRLKPLGHLSGWPVLKGPDDFCK